MMLITKANVALYSWHNNEDGDDDVRILKIMIWLQNLKLINKANVAPYS